MNTPSAVHHEVFHKFQPWEGEIDPQFWVNFLGAKTRRECIDPSIERYFQGNVIASGTIRRNSHNQTFIKTSYPEFNESYLEWIDLLEAVAQAQKEFCMIELGAGFGQWIVNATLALRQRGDIPCRFVGVEPEPTHFQWMKTHLIDNAVSLDSVKLIEAVVSEVEGLVWFYIGKPSEWYGQAVAAPPNMASLQKAILDEEDTLQQVQSVRLNKLLLEFERVDLIDLDVQGKELVVLSDAAEQLRDKVKRVHIGTHSKAIEEGLRALFQGLGWKNVHDYSCESVASTPWGPIEFMDGVQTWINEKIR